jgi:hypothetical protein
MPPTPTVQTEDPYFWDRRVYFRGSYDWRGLPPAFPDLKGATPTDTVRPITVDAIDPDRARYASVLMAADIGAGSAQYRQWNGAAWINAGAPVAITCATTGLHGASNLLRHWLPPDNTWPLVLPFLPCQLTLPAGWATGVAGGTSDPLANLLPSGGVTVLPVATAVMAVPMAYLASINACEPSVWIWFNGPVVPGPKWTDPVSTTFPYTRSTTLLNPSAWFHDARFPNVVRVKINAASYSFNAAHNITLAADWVTAADGTPLGAAVAVSVTKQAIPAMRWMPSASPEAVDTYAGAAYPKQGTPADGEKTSTLPSTLLNSFGEYPVAAVAPFVLSPRDTHSLPPSHICNRKVGSMNAWDQRFVQLGAESLHEDGRIWIEAEVDGFADLDLGILSKYAARSAAFLKLATALPAGYTLDVHIQRPFLAPGGHIPVYNMRTRQMHQAWTAIALHDPTYSADDYEASCDSIGAPQVGNAAATDFPYFNVDENPTTIAHNLLWLAADIYTIAPPVGDLGWTGTRHGWITGDKILIPVRAFPFRDRDGIYPIIWQPQTTHWRPPFSGYQTDNYGFRGINGTPGVPFDKQGLRTVGPFTPSVGERTDWFMWLPARAYANTGSGNAFRGVFDGLTGDGYLHASFAPGFEPGPGDGFNVTVRIYETHADPSIPYDLLIEDPTAAGWYTGPRSAPASWTLLHTHTQYCGDPVDWGPSGTIPGWEDFRFPLSFTLNHADRVKRLAVCMEWSTGFGNLALSDTPYWEFSLYTLQRNIPWPVPLHDLTTLDTVVKPQLIDGNAHIP